MSVFWMYLKSESFNLLIYLQFMLICYYHNTLLAIKKFRLYFFCTDSSCHIHCSFPRPSNCLSLRGLLEPMHLTQMKEKPEISYISVDSGTVCRMDPLLRSSYFGKKSAFWGLNNRKAQTFSNNKGSLVSRLNQQAFLANVRGFFHSHRSE